MIVTIDGPAGTGKSSVARAVAERLGFDFLDTGAMYRAVALEAVRRGTDLADARGLAFVARHARVTFDFSKRPPTVLLSGEPVGHLLRSGEVTRAASYVAVVPAVRGLLVRRQREIAAARANLVTEGRDQGTVVFPTAALKVYLDADPEERARRRVAQLRARGEVVEFRDVLDGIVARDTRDSTRAVGPLAAAVDAVRVDTSRMTEPQVVDHIVDLARRAGAAAPASVPAPTAGAAR